MHEHYLLQTESKILACVHACTSTRVLFEELRKAGFPAFCKYLSKLVTFSPHADPMSNINMGD